MLNETLNDSHSSPPTPIGANFAESARPGGRVPLLWEGVVGTGGRLGRGGGRAATTGVSWAGGAALLASPHDERLAPTPGAPTPAGSTYSV